MDGSNITAFFGHFKNSHSFKNLLPLKVPVEEQKLKAVFKKYLSVLKSDALFPKRNEVGSEPMSAAAFGKLIGDISEELTRKRFTVQRMRVSFITNWHKEHTQGKTVDLKQVQKVMRQLLQTNIAVHLGYAKKNENAEQILAKQMKKMQQDTDD